MPQNLRVYAITDRTVMTSGDFLNQIEQALSGGIRALQLREKDLSPKALMELARPLAKKVAGYKASLFINDRVDIAKMVGAEGVHLTEKSIAASDVKQSFPDLSVGVSTHSLQSAKKAEQDGADFITFGPVYDTPSKTQYGPAQGLEKLKTLTQSLRIPVLALGGLTLKNVEDTLSCGVQGVALIRGLWQSPDIKKTALTWQHIIGGKPL